MFSKKNTPQNSKKTQKMFPLLFDVTDLAVLIFGFLPWLQYRQWFLECDDCELQTRLCKWCPGSVMRLGMQTIIKKSNFTLLNQFPMDTWDWGCLYGHASPQMLDTVWQHQLRHNQSCNPKVNYDEVSFETLKVVVKYFYIGFSKQAQLIMNALYRDDKQRLHWMLHDMQWVGFIGSDIDWEIGLFITIESKLLTEHFACRDLALQIKSRLFSQLPQLALDVRHQLFLHSFFNPAVAQVLWLPEFQFPNMHLNTVPLIEHVLSFVWDARLSKLTECSFKPALFTHIRDFVLSLSFEKRWDTLKECCIYGSPHLAKLIWKESTWDERYKLTTSLHYASKSRNLEMIDFAYKLMRYNTTTYYDMVQEWCDEVQKYDNSSMWQYLILNEMLPKDKVGIFYHRFFPWSYGSDTVAFIAQVQTKSHQWFYQHFVDIFDQAVQYANVPVLHFLSKQDVFLINYAVKHKHLVCLAKHGIIDALRFIQHPTFIDPQTLCDAYVDALDVPTLQALHDLKLIPEQNRFENTLIQKIKLTDHLQVQKCTFFAKHHFITTKRIHHIFHNSLCGYLYDDLLGALYCDVELC